MQQRRVAAGSGLSTSLSTTIKYVRRSASGAAGNGHNTSMNYLRRTKNGAAGNKRLGHHDQVSVTSNCRLICRVFFSCCDSAA
jgi:hypothetical protein